LTRPLLQDTWVISETGTNVSVPVIYPWLNATGMDHMTRPGFLLALFDFKKVPKNAQFLASVPNLAKPALKKLS
jgi:hypothetical protein